jgi:hypothetical protein
MTGKEAIKTIEFAVKLYLDTHKIIFTEELRQLKEYDFIDDAQQDLEYEKLYEYSRGYKDFAQAMLSVLKEKHNEF